MLPGPSDGSHGAVSSPDDGRYFYGETEAGLRAAIAAGTRTDHRFRKVLDAALAAGRLAPEAGRARMLDASPAPAFRESAMPPVRAREPRDLAPVPHDRASLDSQLWTAALDALTAARATRGSRGRPARPDDRRRTVAVDATSDAGRPVLRLRATDAGRDYEERLLLDARTGVIVRMEGGAPGVRPDVTIVYEVRRVDRATLGA